MRRTVLPPSKPLSVKSLENPPPPAMRAAGRTVEHRPFPIAALASTLVHLLLLLILSLIALGRPPTMSHLTFDLASSSAPPLDALPAIAVTEPSLEEAEPSESSAMDLALTAVEIAPLPVDMVMVPEGITSSMEEAVAPEGSANSVLAQVAGRIQKRIAEEGGQQGEVQFALAWSNRNDVDLHVIAPSGEHISFQHRRSRCQGMLDVDMNVRGESDAPVENIRWLRHAPPGRYTVLVHLFRIHRPGVNYRGDHRRSPFELLVKLGPEQFLEHATVSIGHQLVVYRFVYIPHSLPLSEQQRMREDLQTLQAREEQDGAAMLSGALAIANRRQREEALYTLAAALPHTDAAITALQLIKGSTTKR
ncbi:MAG: hypothetical protein KatS3mg111_1558 [Pirellulaceae bacterium]|nr:MAG: hypothetical protein KatS3mg111_1558 [Pirellulaceae bacterium]